MIRYNLRPKNHQATKSSKKRKDINNQTVAATDLKPLVLQDLLDRDGLAGLAELGLVDDAEAAVADDLGVGVGDLLGAVRSGAGGRHHCRHLAAVLACIVHRATHRK